jgi:hypothetical protein
MPRKRARAREADTALQILVDAHASKKERRLDDRTAQHIRAEIRRWHLAGEVLGYGVGPKLVSDIWTGQTALQIHVRRKRPINVLPPSSVIPSTLDWPGLDKPVLVDVVERGAFRPAGLDGFERPIFPGLTVGHCISGETGSIGAVVKAFGDAERYVLGAAHVLAAAGRAQIGDEIVQPGGLDGGQCPSQTIGELNAFVSFKSGTGFPNVADAALVKLRADIEDIGGPRPINGLAIRQNLHIHDVLFCIGCRTGERSVLVKNPSHATTIEFTLPSGGRARFGFRDLILYKDFSQQGDSGGPLTDDSGALVGIHVAKTDDGFGLAVPVWSLPAEWNVTI